MESLNFNLLITFSTFLIYTIIEFVIGINQKQHANYQKSEDKFSFLVLSLLNFIGVATSILISYFKICLWSNLIAFTIIGLLIFLTGLTIRLFAIKKLGEFFAFTVTKSTEQRIIKNGIYRYIRHPGYLGQMLVFISISVLSASYLSVIIMILFSITGYSYRIHIEEKFLLDEFGKEYENYKKVTKKIIPFIY